VLIAVAGRIGTPTDWTTDSPSWGVVVEDAKASPTQVAVDQAAVQLVEALHATAWTDAEYAKFPPATCEGLGLRPDPFTLEQTAGGEAINEALLAVCGGEVGYLVEPNMSAAQRASDAVIALLGESKPAAKMLGGSVYPRMGSTSFYYRVVGNVLIAAYYNADQAIAETYAYDLVQAGITHLEHAKASLDNSETQHATTSTPASTGQIADLLPTQNDVPNGLVIVAENQRTLDQVAQNYSDPSDTTKRFTHWGWKGNVTRTFGVPPGGSAPVGGTISIYVSIHKFGKGSYAQDALNYSFDNQVGSTGAAEVTAPNVGDGSRAMSVTTDSGNEATIYVRKGSALLRITVMSVNANPLNEAVFIALNLLTK
jgi:hypothetical protein